MGHSCFFLGVGGGGGGGLGNGIGRVFWRVGLFFFVVFLFLVEWVVFVSLYLLFFRN